MQHGSHTTESVLRGVARIKIAYIGGGSTRAAGTMASFIEQGANFGGSEIVLGPPLIMNRTNIDNFDF